MRSAAYLLLQVYNMQPVNDRLACCLPLRACVHSSLVHVHMHSNADQRDCAFHPLQTFLGVRVHSSCAQYANDLLSSKGNHNTHMYTHKIVTRACVIINVCVGLYSCRARVLR